MNANLAIPAAAFLLLLTGCGDILTTYSPTAPKDAYGMANLSASSATPQGIYDANYNCPTADNVEPDPGALGTSFSYVGTDGRYTVCPSKTNTTDILIHGQTSRSICVFPDVVNGSPTGAYQCGQMTTNGLQMTFNGANGASYNAVFIVDQSNLGQMLYCLQLQSYYQCPGYSYGSFR